MDLMTWLPVAWFAVIGFGVLMYVASASSPRSPRTRNSWT